MSDRPTDPDRSRGRDGDGRGRDEDRSGRDTDRRRIGSDRRGRDDLRRDPRSERKRREVDWFDVDAERHGIDRANPPTPDAERERGQADAREEDRAVGSTSRMWLNGVVALVGLWIAASAFVYDPTRAALWNNVATGGGIFLLAGYSSYRLLRDAGPAVESPGLAALLGLWAVVAPLLLGYGSDALVWSTMASGVAVAVLSGYNAYESRRSESARSTRTGV